MFTPKEKGNRGHHPTELAGGEAMNSAPAARRPDKHTRARVERGRSAFDQHLPPQSSPTSRPCIVPQRRAGPTSTHATGSMES
uniref:Uncharacterized protein n=1 Tax=Arundo donax TaxID=35708 RepID=A0A0A9C2F8_ARUDO